MPSLGLLLTELLVRLACFASERNNPDHARSKAALIGWRLSWIQWLGFEVEDLQDFGRRCERYGHRATVLDKCWYRMTIAKFSVWHERSGVHVKSVSCRTPSGLAMMPTLFNSALVCPEPAKVSWKYWKPGEQPAQMPGKL